MKLLTILSIILLGIFTILTLSDIGYTSEDKYVCEQCPNSSYLMCNCEHTVEKYLNNVIGSISIISGIGGLILFLYSVK